MIKNLKNLKSLLKDTNADYNITRLIKISELGPDKAQLKIIEDLYGLLEQITPGFGVYLSEVQILELIASEIEDEFDLEELKKLHPDHPDHPDFNVLEVGDTLEEIFSKVSGSATNDKELLNIIVSFFLEKNKNV